MNWSPSGRPCGLLLNWHQWWTLYLPCDAEGIWLTDESGVTSNMDSSQWHFLLDRPHAWLSSCVTWCLTTTLSNILNLFSGSCRLASNVSSVSTPSWSPDTDTSSILSNMFTLGYLPQTTFNSLPPFSFPRFPPCFWHIWPVVLSVVIGPIIVQFCWILLLCVSSPLH